MPLPDHWSNPNTTRARLVLEMANDLVTPERLPVLQAPYFEPRITIKERAGVPITLYGSGTIEGIWSVAHGEATLALVNPSTALAMAVRGTPPFDEPLPLRTLAVLPSADQLAFAVKSETGLRTLEEIGTKRYPLRISTRGTESHSLHFMIERIAECAGFPMDQLRAWGGDVVHEGGFPRVTTPKVSAMARGEVVALAEEGVEEWLPVALEAGMTILSMAEETVRKLERLGFRRAIIPKALYPALPADVLTVSFSGWPLFVRADLSDKIATRLCAALEARKAHIPWQGEGPLPVERMCSDSDATPIDAPLHPAAEEYWRSLGYPVGMRDIPAKVKPSGRLGYVE